MDEGDVDIVRVCVCVFLRACVRASDRARVCSCFEYIRRIVRISEQLCVSN